MDRQLLINNNEQATRALYKAYSVMLAILPFAGIVTFLDSDVWHILSNGRYIMENGLPFIEPFSMHSGLAYIAQQWLADCVYWVLYSNYGVRGAVAFVFLIAGISYFLLRKICMITSGGKWLCATNVSFFAAIMLSVFMCTRPQIISYLCWLIEILCLETYIRKRDVKVLLPIPLIAVTAVNCHAALWLMVPVLIVPYLADAVPFKSERLCVAGFKERKPLVFILIASLIAGFLNPYGTKAMFYVFRSINADTVIYINEMTPLSTRSGALGIIILACTFASVAILAQSRRPISAHSIFLLVGGIAAALMSLRNIPVFAIAAAPVMAEYAVTESENKNDQGADSTPEPSIKKLETMFFVKLLSCFVCLAAIVVICLHIGKDFANPKEESIKENIDVLIDCLQEKRDKAGENIVLYAGYNEGGYCEYRGFACYIDARAETYLKKNNGVKDILTEYYDVVCRGTKDYREFVDEYQFTHMILPKNNGLFDELISHDDAFRIVKETETHTLFATKYAK